MDSTYNFQTVAKPNFFNVKEFFNESDYMLDRYFIINYYLIKARWRCLGIYSMIRSIRLVKSDINFRNLVEKINKSNNNNNKQTNLESFSVIDDAGLNYRPRPFSN